jgi:hypothetical protein
LPPSIFSIGSSAMSISFIARLGSKTAVPWDICSALLKGLGFAAASPFTGVRSLGYFTLRRGFAMTRLRRDFSRLRWFVLIWNLGIIIFISLFAVAALVG